MRNRNILVNIDWLSILLYLALLVVGWFSVFSATYDGSEVELFGFSTNYSKQLFWGFAAIFAGIVLIILDSKFYTTFAYVIYGAVLGLLILVLILGTTVSGSLSWIDIGGVRIQPAEFAKFGAALAIAKFISSTNNFSKSATAKLIAGAIILAPMILVQLQGDTGSALVFTSFIFVLFREGLSPLFLIVGFLVLILSVLALIMNNFLLIGILLGLTIIFSILNRRRTQLVFVATGLLVFCSIYITTVDVFFDKLKPHQKDRINVLFGKEQDARGTAYNVNQSLIAIGSGGLWGKGFLNGTQTSFDFIPEQSTDFIFCTIGEEHGFIGSFTVVALMVALLLRILHLAERQRSSFSRVYGYSVACILFFHFTINIGMTIALIPVIGIPLPFISYGGSSLLAFTILLFILLKLDSDRLTILR